MKILKFLLSITMLIVIMSMIACTEQEGAVINEIKADSPIVSAYTESELYHLDVLQLDPNETEDYSLEEAMDILERGSKIRNSRVAKLKSETKVLKNACDLNSVRGYDISSFCDYTTSISITAKNRNYRFAGSFMINENGTRSWGVISSYEMICNSAVKLEGSITRMGFQRNLDIPFSATVFDDEIFGQYISYCVGGCEIGVPIDVIADEDEGFDFEICDFTNFYQRSSISLSHSGDCGDQCLTIIDVF